MALNFFEDFEISSIKIKNGSIRYRKAGHGPALLMLHGNPQTHLMWHKVAPALTKKFTVICPDIPGMENPINLKYLKIMKTTQKLVWHLI